MRHFLSVRSALSVVVNEMENSFSYKEEGYKILGSCFEVYNDKGSGFLEAVYQECLSIEFSLQEIPYLKKPKVELEYKSRKLLQTYEPDFICFRDIVVELKAVKTLLTEHRSQIINYLKALRKPLGYLVNFGAHPKLEYERYVLTTNRVEKVPGR